MKEIYPGITEDMLSKEIPSEFRNQPGYKTRCDDSSTIQVWQDGHKNKVDVCTVKECKDLYYGSRLTVFELAERLGTSPFKMSKEMKRHGIRALKPQLHPGSLKSRINANSKVKVTKSRRGYPTTRVTNPDTGFLNTKWEHVVIAEDIIGRPLNRYENVHHIDFDKSNNDPSNLAICDPSRHGIIHWSAIETVKSLLKLGLVIFDGEKYALDYSMISDNIILREKYPTSKD